MEAHAKMLATQVTRSLPASSATVPLHELKGLPNTGPQTFAPQNDGQHSNASASVSNDTISLNAASQVHTLPVMHDDRESSHDAQSPDQFSIDDAGPILQNSPYGIVAETRLPDPPITPIQSRSSIDAPNRKLDFDQTVAGGTSSSPSSGAIEPTSNATQMTSMMEKMEFLMSGFLGFLKETNEFWKERIRREELEDRLTRECKELEDRLDLLSERGVGYSSREGYADNTPSDNAQVDNVQSHFDVRKRSFNFRKVDDAQLSTPTPGDHYSHTGEAIGEFQSYHYLRSLVRTLEEPTSSPSCGAPVSMQSSSNKNSNKMRSPWADIDDDEKLSRLHGLRKLNWIDRWRK